MLGALALAGADGGGGDTREVRMVFDNAFGLVEGGDFRIGGVRAGQTTGFDVLSSKSGPPKAIVKATIDRSGPAAELRRDANCTIRPQSLVGEYYVDCQPGSSREPLTDEDVVPLRQTEGTIPQDLVNDVLRRPTRERLRLFVASLGTGLAGRPDDIQAVLRRSFPGLRETRKTLRILGDQNQTIEQFITDADTVVTRLRRAPRRRDRLHPRVARRGRDRRLAPGRAARGRAPAARLPDRAAAHHGGAVEPGQAGHARWPPTSSGRHRPPPRCSGAWARSPRRPGPRCAGSARRPFRPPRVCARATRS